MKNIIKQLSDYHKEKSMKSLRNRLVLGLGVLFISTTVMADCGWGLGYRHGNGGGFIALTAYVEPMVYVGQGASICNFSNVLGNARIEGEAEINDFATVSGDVTIKGYARVSQYAHLESRNGITISESAEIRENAVVLDRAVIKGNAQIHGHARIVEDSEISGNAEIYGHAQVSRSRVFGNAKVHGFSILETDSSVSGNALVCDDETFSTATITEGRRHCLSSSRFFASSSSSTALHQCKIASLNLIDKGQVYCWGSSSLLGIENEPKAIPGLNNATSISAGQDFSCAIIEDGVTPGQIKCWGAGSSGQLGNGASTDSLTPVLVTGISNAYKITSGSEYSCALTDDGVVKKTFCWGSNNNGQLGLGDNTDRDIPTEITGLSNPFTDIYAGDNTTCAVQGDVATASAKCWGNLSNGQLGNGISSGNSNVPASVINLSGLGNNPLTQIAVGGSHVCAFDNTYRIICWGKNQYGAFGNGGIIGNPQIEVPNLSYFEGDPTTQLFALNLGTCAYVAGEKRLFCWGYNSQGQLGNGNNISTSTPFEIEIEDGFKLFGNSSNSACATDDSNSILCWGAGSSGQIGDGGYQNRNVPTYSKYIL